jgi:hypothetical protein
MQFTLAHDGRRVAIVADKITAIEEPPRYTAVNTPGAHFLVKETYDQIVDLTDTRYSNGEKWAIVEEPAF